MTMFDAVSDTMRKDLVEFYCYYVVNGSESKLKRLIEERAEFLYNGSVALIDKIDDDLNEPISYLQNFTSARFPGKKQPSKYSALKMLEKLLHLSYAVKKETGETKCN